MTSTQFKADRKTALHGIKVGDTVRVVRVGYGYAGAGSGEVIGTATVVKVLAKSVRVQWSESGKGTTDFSRDSGKPVGERRWINYPVIDVIAAPTVGPSF